MRLSEVEDSNLFLFLDKPVWHVKIEEPAPVKIYVRCSCRNEDYICTLENDQFPDYF